MSVCNIYKSQGNKPVFYTFSEYMNDLVVNINNDGMSVARPSRFLCVKLNNINNINVFLQNYYEDACCTLRDKNVTDYRKYLLGGLIDGLIKKGFINESDINNIACEDIDLFGDGTIDGMKYDEIEASGLMTPLVELNCKYKRPAYYNQEVEIRTKM